MATVEPHRPPNAARRRALLLAIACMALLGATASSGRFVGGGEESLPFASDVPLPTALALQVVEKHDSSGDAQEGQLHKLLTAECIDLPSTWGYAMERNAARWRIIRESIQQHYPPSWVVQPNATLSVLDLGADQGFFTLSMLRLLQQLSQHGVRPPAVGLAVEKGGFGGAFWKAKDFAAAGRSVHDVIREQYLHMVRQPALEASGTQQAVASMHVPPSLYLCPTSIRLATLDDVFAPAPRGHQSIMPSCHVSVLFALSMLHWVDGIDGAHGFRRAICLLASGADVVFLELPHPAARRTFGEKRYRGWYGGNARRNVTALLEDVLLQCPRAVAQTNQHDACVYRVTLAGQTPWGRGLFREIHRIDRQCPSTVIGGAASIVVGSAPSVAATVDGCAVPFGCNRVVE